MDQLLFAAYQDDVALRIQKAQESGCGLELHTFTDPKTLATNLAAQLLTHKSLLANFSGILGLHGAFYDMISASVDPDIVAITRRRYEQNLWIARELKARYIVFHANYMGTFKLVNYRAGWHKRQVAFWESFIEQAAESGIYILLENMWEDDPSVIIDVIQAVNHPHLKACLDVAHATLFSDRPIQEWIEQFAPFLFCCHLNNHDGLLDLHWPLSRGCVDYQSVLPLLRHLPMPPLMTLEMSNWDSIEKSLNYFELAESS